MKNISNKFISSFLIDNKLITSANQISNHFNSYFTGIAEKNKQKHCPSKKTHLSYLDTKKNNIIFLSPTVLEDIKDLVSSMETNKAGGLNSDL